MWDKMFETKNLLKNIFLYKMIFLGKLFNFKILTNTILMNAKTEKKNF